MLVAWSCCTNTELYIKNSEFREYLNSGFREYLNQLARRDLDLIYIPHLVNTEPQHEYHGLKPHIRIIVVPKTSAMADDEVCIFQHIHICNPHLYLAHPCLLYNSRISIHMTVVAYMYICIHIVSGCLMKVMTHKSFATRPMFNHVDQSFFGCLIHKQPFIIFMFSAQIYFVSLHLYCWVYGACVGYPCDLRVGLWWLGGPGWCRNLRCTGRGWDGTETERRSRA